MSYRGSNPTLSQTPRSGSPSPVASSGAITPNTTDQQSASSSTFLGSSVSSLWGGLFRRFSSDPLISPAGTPSSKPPHHARTFADGNHYSTGNGLDGVYTPPQLLKRSASPAMFGGRSGSQPPPLEPLQLKGFSADTPASARLLTPTIAEEIRIMVPARLGISEEWDLVYSLDQDGASLATLYEKCAKYSGKRVGFVLVVKDCEGGIFGAYLSDYPHPAPKYFGTGECFLWRASVMAALPPPPSADTTNLTGRSTTITSNTNHNRSSTSLSQRSETIRFKAFPYSGVNEYYMLCEQHFLSLGAGDGRYGLWLDDGLERGVSATSQTFGNEPLSDEGEKFGILGVEVWVIGG